MATPSKICILSTSHRRQDERIFHKQGRSLAAAGYDVSFIVQHDKEECVDGIRILPLPRPTNRFQRYVVGGLRALRLALRQKADLYHLHDPELLPVAIMLRLLGKKVICDVHEDYASHLASRHVNRVVGLLLAAGWRVVEKTTGACVNHVITADSHTQKRFPTQKTTVVANFPPLRFGEVTCQPRTHDTLRIAYVGGISADRGINRLIEAIDHLKHTAVELHLAGETTDQDLLSLFSQHPKLIYHGRIPWEDVNRYLARSDLGVVLLQPIPAYTYCPGENIVKLFEYMSVGLPVLFSDFPKLRRFLDPIGAGMPVDPTSPEKIAQAIDYLYENPSVRQEMGENGRKAVRDRFNWEHEEKKLLKIYQEVLVGRR